jgi:hypothetical protein
VGRARVGDPESGRKQAFVGEIGRDTLHDLAESLKSEFPQTRKDALWKRNIGQQRVSLDYCRGGWGLQQTLFPADGGGPYCLSTGLETDI